MKSQLSNALDKIYRDPKNAYSIAKEETLSLTLDSMLVVAALDVGASFGLSRGKVTIEKPNTIKLASLNGEYYFEVLLTTHTSNLQELIVYSDTSYKVVLSPSSQYIPTKTFKHNTSNLLIGMQILRDYLESTYHLGREMRIKKISEYSIESNLDFEYFNNLAIWFSSIQDYLE